MPKLIKDNAIVECSRARLPKDATADAIASASDIVPLNLWLNHTETCRQKGINAVWIDSDQLSEALESTLDDLALIAVNFPTFMDGRGFSIGRLLRERLGYLGELRAVGNVIQDQLHFLLRCGFNAFEPREATDLASALTSLNDFSEHYQQAVVQDKPLYWRRSA